jgi:FMN phosphatase YigB (HAD superfamily)
MKATPSVIICDLGNVLAFYNRDITYKKMAAHLPHEADEIGERIEGSGLRQKFELGEIDETAFFLQVINLFDPPHEMGYDMFCHFYGEIFTTNRGLLKFLKRYEGKTTFVLLSNTSSLHFDVIQKKHPEILELFNGKHLLSYEQGMLKPDKEMFAKAIEMAECDITYADCLFLDDVEENINVAASLGMMTHQYVGLLDFANFLKTLPALGNNQVH